MKKKKEIIMIDIEDYISPDPEIESWAKDFVLAKSPEEVDQFIKTIEEALKESDAAENK